MTQIRQRQVRVQVTSADPSGKVFKGIYADSSYETLLTTNKTYGFKLNAGQIEELYIRYSQKPITITFKSNPAVIYQVTGSFGTVEVGALTDVVKTIEFPTDTTPDLTIGFTSATLNGSQWKISATKINGNAMALPYSMVSVTPGSNITFEIEVISATTTTTTTTTTSTTSTVAPATLKLQSNAGGTVVEIAPDGLDTKEVSLPLENSTYVEVDMRNAPLVDA